MYDQGTVGHCDHRRLKRPIVPIATITKTPFAKDVAVRAVGQKTASLSVRDLMPVVKLDHESHIISFQLHTEPLKQGSVNLHSNFGADANLELLECTIVQLYHVHRCQGPVKSCLCVPRARPALIYCHQGFLRVRPG